MTDSRKEKLSLQKLAASSALAIHPAEDPDVDNFDDAALGEIPPGQTMDRTHFRVQTDAHTTAGIVYENPDDPALGRKLGVVKGEEATSLSLWFSRPRRSVTLTLLAPPGLPDTVTIATLLGPGNVDLHALTVYHDRSAQQVRFGMTLPSSGSFDGVKLQMPIGTYIDKVEMLSPIDSSKEEVDFDDLPVGPLPGLIVQPKYFIIVGRGKIKIAQATEGETSGHVLTSDTALGNEVTVIFATRRDTLDLTVVPNPDNPDASLIEFLSGGNFETLKGIPIDAAGGTQHLSYTEHAPGKNIQGVRWTGSRLTLDHLILHSGK